MESNNPGAILAGMRKHHAITCKICGKAATKRDPRAMYCSAACRQKAKRKIKVECPNALLPDGPICPRCGERRGPSGVDGGSWVHY